MYQKKLQKLLSAGGEPAPTSDSQDTADTVPIDELDFSADSDPEPGEITDSWWLTGGIKMKKFYS